MRTEERTLPAGFREPCELAGLPEGTPMAVAFSGGADSVALLSMLRDRPHLMAIHVHHNIRGEEADRDAAFCRRTAEALGIPFLLLSVDAPALAKARGVSLETAARDARYEALCQALRERDIPLLLTAHHADDQLETMLQHLIRGCGTRGLAGIPACRALEKGIVVARPLLQIPKSELLRYVEAVGLDYVTDSTNDVPCCQRNILRLSVLPLLSELQPGAAPAAARCAEALAEDERYLDECAAAFLKKEGTAPAVATLRALPVPILARVMRRLLPVVPTAHHIKELQALLENEKPHATLSLPRARARIERGHLQILPPGEDAASPYCLSLSHGCNESADGRVRILVGTSAPELTTGYPYVTELWLDAAAIQGSLLARPREPGDRILSCGMHKAVRRLPELAHLPPEVRARMPLLLDEKGVLAIPFGPIRDGMRQKTLPVTLCFT